MLKVRRQPPFHPLVRSFAQELGQALAGEESTPGSSSFERALHAFEAMLREMPQPGSMATRPRWAVELGVDVPSDVRECKRAFRRLAFETHPDRPGGSHEAFLRAQALLDEALTSLQKDKTPKVLPSNAFRFERNAPRLDLGAVYA